MKPEFRRLRSKQLDRALEPFLAAKGFQRPSKGWIRAIRESTGLTAREMASRLGRTSPSLVSALEKSEAECRITLGSLRKAAEAMDCRLVYALVPKNGNIQQLSERRTRVKAAENVRAVEHTMALEDQAVGGIDEKIDEQTNRMLKRA